MEEIYTILTMVGSSFCYHGDSLVVKLLPKLPTRNSTFQMKSSLIILHTGTTKNYHLVTTVHKQKFAPPTPHFHLVTSTRQISRICFTTRIFPTHFFFTHILIQLIKMAPRTHLVTYGDSEKIFTSSNLKLESYKNFTCDQCVTTNSRYIHCLENLSISGAQHENVKPTFLKTNSSFPWFKRK